MTSKPKRASESPPESPPKRLRQSETRNPRRGAGGGSKVQGSPEIERRLSRCNSDLNQQSVHTDCQERSEAFVNPCGSSTQDRQRSVGQVDGAQPEAKQRDKRYSTRSADQQSGGQGAAKPKAKPRNG